MASETEVRIEPRLARIEGMVEQINEHQNRLSQDVSDLRKDMNQHIGDLRKDMSQHIGDLRKDMNQHIGDSRREMREDLRELRTDVRRLYYIIIIMWVTIVLAIFSAVIMVLTVV